MRVSFTQSLGWPASASLTRAFQDAVPTLKEMAESFAATKDDERTLLVLLSCACRCEKHDRTTRLDRSHTVLVSPIRDNDNGEQLNVFTIDLLPPHKGADPSDKRIAKDLPEFFAAWQTTLESAFAPA